MNLSVGMKNIMWNGNKFRAIDFIVLERFIFISIRIHFMQYKITKWQILLIVLGCLAGAVSGAFLSPKYICFNPNAPCTPIFGYMIIGSIFGLVITYTTTFVLNNIKK